MIHARLKSVDLHKQCNVGLDMNALFVATTPTKSCGSTIPLPMVPSIRTQVESGLNNERLSALIEAVAAVRDRKAFSELFTYFAPRLKAFGLRQGASAAAAEELAQEAMIALWRKADTFDRKRATVERSHA